MRYLPKILLAASLLAGIPAQAVTEINYWLWDNNQLPAYQACASAFEKQNPDIKINITQTGCIDYWNALTTTFVSATAPDAVTHPLPVYPELIPATLVGARAPRIA